MLPLPPVIAPLSMKPLACSGNQLKALFLTGEGLFFDERDAPHKVLPPPGPLLSQVF